MNDNEQKEQLGELIKLAMDCMGIAVTIIDTKGILLYYLKFHRYLGLSGSAANFGLIIFRDPKKLGTEFEKFFNYYANYFNDLCFIFTCTPSLFMIGYPHNLLIS